MNQFIQPTGPKLPEHFDTETALTLEYFQLFFSGEVLHTIVQNTNRYVQYSVQQKQLTKPDYTEYFWTDTFLLEMKAYFGLAIMFGVLNQPRYKNNW